MSDEKHHKYRYENNRKIEFENKSMKISKDYCDSQEYHQAMVNQKSMRMRQCVSDDYHEQYVNQRVNNKFCVF